MTTLNLNSTTENKPKLIFASSFQVYKPIKDKIAWAVQNQNKLNSFSKRMYHLRNWDSIGKEYNKVIMELAI